MQLFFAFGNLIFGYRWIYFVDEKVTRLYLSYI